MENQLLELLNNPDIMQKLSNIPELIGKSGDELIKYVLLNPGILSTIQGVKDSVSGIFNRPVVSPEITATIEGVKYFYDIKNILIMLIILWGVGVIIARFTVKEEAKNDVAFVNTLLIGNIGIIPIITSIWLLALLGVTLVPMTLSLVPKLDTLSISASSLLNNIGSNLPNLMKAGKK